MRILIDHDEVICGFVERMVDVYNGYYNETGASVSVSSITNFYFSDVIPKPIVKAIMRHGHFYDGVMPLPGAIDGMKRLMERGHEVIIVTTILSSIPGLYEQKVEWIERYLPTFDMDDFVTTSRKDLVAGNVLFDDAIHNLEPYRDAHPAAVCIAMDRPWNASWIGSRVASWDEFVPFVETIDPWSS